jgi:NADP-dependent 3-hydroxy acid dehydrogenase YdfG
MIAEGLVDAGAKVYITSRKQDTCEQAALEMSERSSCVPLLGDLVTPAAAVAPAEQIKARESRLLGCR